MATISIEPLSREAFAPFGQVIETEGAQHFPINAGMTERYHDLAQVELAGPGARAMISLFAGRPYALPLTLSMVERHPLGSQAFYPLDATDWLVIVAADAEGRPALPRAFRPTPGQGVNIGRNVWHGVLCPLDQPARFLVVDRGGDGVNLEEHFFPESHLVL